MNHSRITIPLHIPDVRVLEVQVMPEGDYLLTIESTLKSAHCRKCGQLIRKVHGADEWVIVRPLPILGHQTYLRFRPKRFACEDCAGKPGTRVPVNTGMPPRISSSRVIKGCVSISIDLMRRMA